MCYGSALLTKKEIVCYELLRKLITKHSANKKKKIEINIHPNFIQTLNTIIEKDCSVKIFTSKDKEGLETIRHDTAHVLAMAVQELFPGTQVTIGPVIEDGCLLYTSPSPRDS